jgi:hypothetical protein
MSVYIYMHLNAQYIAGFFDADGSVGIYNRASRNKNVYQVNVAIANSGTHGLMICKALVEQFGGCVTHQKKVKKDTHRSVFWYRLNGGKVLKDFLEYISPHVIIKKDQIDIALQFIEEKSKMPKYGKSEEQYGRLAELALKCKEYKRYDIE